MTPPIISAGRERLATDEDEITVLLREYCEVGRSILADTGPLKGDIAKVARVSGDPQYSDRLRRIGRIRLSLEGLGVIPPCISDLMQDSGAIAMTEQHRACEH